MAILIKSHIRHAAEDSTPLYGEAAQRHMRLWEDCYTYTSSAQVYVNTTSAKTKRNPPHDPH